MVEQLAGLVVPDDEICRMVLWDGQPISETSLKNHFGKELSTGRTKLRVRHHMALFKNVEDGNVTAQIWWDKTRHHIHERAGTPSVYVNQTNVAPTEVAALPAEQRSLLEVGRRLAYALNMAAEAS